MSTAKSYVKTQLSQHIIIIDDIGKRILNILFKERLFTNRIDMIIYGAKHFQKLSFRAFKHLLIFMIKEKECNVSNMITYIEDKCKQWNYNWNAQAEKFIKGKGNVFDYFVTEQYIRYLETHIYAGDKQEISMLNMLQLTENMYT